MRSFLPGFAHAPIRALESALSPLMPRIAMFAQVTLVRTPTAPGPPRA
jgi:hypothetical protein